MLATLMALASATGTAGAQVEVTVADGESIQAAIDAAAPGTRIIVEGAHVENLWINKDGIELVGAPGSSVTLPEAISLAPCGATLICVFPDTEEEPPDPADYIDGVRIEGLTLNSPEFDAIGALFTNDVVIRRNRIANPGCDGVFVIFATGFRIDRNRVSGAECSGIHVVASTSGRIHRNVSTGSEMNGVGLDDSSRVKVSSNRVSGNCVGIVVANGPDEGFGGIFPEDQPSRFVRILRNRAIGNNSTCDFGPAQIGITGILVGGAERVLIKRNVASNNTSDAESLTAGGIVVTDFPNDDGTSFAATDGVRIIRNQARGNSSAGGPADLIVTTTGRVGVVRGNGCDVGIPPDVC